MTYPELFLTAIALSMDAFAVSICTGLTMPRFTFKKAGIVGLYFGFFQAAMPVAGYFAATLFADRIVAYDHWIAFALLFFLGVRMIAGSFRKDKDGAAADSGENATGGNEASLRPASMLPLAVATSIDALAVGVSFAFLQVDIVPAVSLIGVTTLVLSVLGVKVGNMFGLRFKSKAELAGGVILTLIGINILLEHLGVYGV